MDRKEFLEDAGLSRPEACRLLGLNKGNFYAFMKGDLTKLSRATAIDACQTLASVWQRAARAPRPERPPPRQGRVSPF